MAYMKLGELLISLNLINREQLNQALEQQKSTRQRIGAIFIEQGIITEQQLIMALHKQLGVEVADLAIAPKMIELAKYVPKNMARKYNIVPVKLENDELYIAMIDPLDFVAIEEVKKASHKDVIPMIATKKTTEQAINALYGSEGAARAIEDMKLEIGSAVQDTSTVQTIQMGDGNELAPTIRFVNSIIERAFTERASDIHLEPQENEMVVRMRIDGMLRKILTVPANLQSTVVLRLKIMGDMNIAERKIPQDGHAMVQVRDHNLDLRISSMPTVFGEKIVIRVLDKTSSLLNKAAVGLEGEDLRKYEALLKNTSGVILLVGPTGSGKSTTLCTMLHQLVREEVNIITLEDPVEYNIPGISQCQINEKTGMTFANGLRAILRQDPDIISVGEIRDGETATIAIRAAITGHVVLSTLHTNDAVSAISRLQDIGVESYLVSSSLRGVISQRLVRKICPICKTEYVPEPSELAMLGIDSSENVKFYKGAGCPDCFHSGYQGRRAVFEILMVNARTRSMISQGATEEAITAAAIEDGMVTMKENCRDLVLRGITTLEEAVRAINTTVG